MWCHLVEFSLGWSYRFSANTSFPVHHSLPNLLYRFILYFNPKRRYRGAQFGKLNVEHKIWLIQSICFSDHTPHSERKCKRYDDKFNLELKNNSFPNWFSSVFEVNFALGYICGAHHSGNRWNFWKCLNSLFNFSFSLWKGALFGGKMSRWSLKQLAKFL